MNTAYFFDSSHEPADEAKEHSARISDSRLRLDHPETVLVVEDEEMIRRLIHLMLGAGGYHVLMAADASEAFRICHEHRGNIDLLLTDMVMPEVNGYHLADSLSLIRPSMTVVYMSGHSEFAAFPPSGDRQEPHFLQKPFTASKLLETVRSALEVKKYWTIPTSARRPRSSNVH